MRLPRKFWNLSSTQSKKKNLFFYFPQRVSFLNQTGLNPILTAFPSKIQVFCRPKLSKIVSFEQFFADLSKNSKAVIAIYAYASECSPFALLENAIGYYAMT